MAQKAGMHYENKLEIHKEKIAKNESVFFLAAGVHKAYCLLTENEDHPRQLDLFTMLRSSGSDISAGIQYLYLHL